MSFKEFTCVYVFDTKNFIFLLALFNFENNSFMPTKIYDFTEYQEMGIVFKYLKHYKGKGQTVSHVTEKNLVIVTRNE